ncbi:MAG: F0F1 ATP synthase subunit alpha, partial [Vulcanimicrobiaceae bacterium]
SVAGQLKLDLAQYRELAAFSKLASDLDKGTQQQLARGDKTTAILVQRQLEPQPMEDEVAVIFAATRGYLDGFETSRLQEWVHRFLDTLHEKHADISQTIRDTGALSDDVQKQLIAAIEDFNKGF